LQQLAAKSSRASASPSTRSQYHPLAACSEHSPIDLLFYNVRLRCCVVMGLKNAELRPEYTGKPGSCFSTVDGELRANGDRLTNGLLLCKTKNDVVTEYSLRDINQPVGVSEYRLGDELPADYAAYPLAGGPEGENLEVRGLPTSKHAIDS